MQDLSIRPEYPTGKDAGHDGAGSSGIVTVDVEVEIQQNSAIGFSLASKLKTKPIQQPDCGL